MTLTFFASITAVPSDIRKIERLVNQAEPSSDPLSHVLTTPLFLGQNSIDLMRQLKDKRGTEICFDSAGYYVQVGKIGYHELYMRLLECYRRNPWADRYVLPDNVPLSTDTPEVVEYKVRETVHYSCLFFQEMPDQLKYKAMPVVHGHTRAQVEYCMEHYNKLGVEWVGFGSFGTFGKNAEANLATNSAIENARIVIHLAEQFGLKVHLFGLGAPALVGMMYDLGATSFDSASWFKTAGFGQVHLPLMRSYNITYNNVSSPLQKGITWCDFTRLKELTGHNCIYCSDYATLAGPKMHRVVHNLFVIDESVQILNNKQFRRAGLIYQSGSVKYRAEGDKWLSLAQI